MFVQSCWAGRALNHAQDSWWERANKVARCRDCEDFNKALNFALVANWSSPLTGVEKPFVYKTKAFLLYSIS